MHRVQTWQSEGDPYEAFSSGVRRFERSGCSALASDDTDPNKP